MEPLARYEHPEGSGYTLTIEHDDYPDAGNPREFENVTTFACDHRDYRLGDGTLAELAGWDPGDFTSYAHLERWLRIYHHALAVLPLGLIDHSGIGMYVGGGAHPHDPGGWDSGMVGVAYVTREDWAACMGENYSGPITPAEAIAQDVSTYDDYLRGHVYGYTVTNPAGKFVDSCWGFLGDARTDYREALKVAPETGSAAEEEGRSVAEAEAAAANLLAAQRESWARIEPIYSCA